MNVAEWEHRRITPHFRWREFRDPHARRPVPLSCRAGVRKLCQNVLEPLRAKFGPATIHSGYRTRETNAEVGGAPASYHIYTDRPAYPAVDISFSRGTVREWAAAAERLGVGGMGVYGSHLHLDGRPTRARW